MILLDLRHLNVVDSDLILIDLYGLLKLGLKPFPLVFTVKVNMQPLKFTVILWSFRCTILADFGEIDRLTLAGGKALGQNASWSG